MEIIQTELRLKDIEWVEKTLDGLKKTGRSLGNNSLVDKARKEEIATVEKVLKTLTVDAKDIRKADWSNKEVIHFPWEWLQLVKNSSSLRIYPLGFFFSVIAFFP
jgi:ribosome-binding ATPase YchF (GTP1/OBG family)